MNTARFDHSLTSLAIACRHTLIAIDLALIGEPLPEEQDEDIGTHLSISTGVWLIAELFETARVTMLFVKDGDPAHRRERTSTLQADFATTSFLLDMGNPLIELPAPMRFEDYFCLLRRAMWTIIEGGIPIRNDVLRTARHICERIAVAIEDMETCPSPKWQRTPVCQKISFRDSHHSMCFASRA